MKLSTTRTPAVRKVIIALSFSFLTGVMGTTQAAGGLSPEIEKKIAEYKKKLESWGSNQEIIKAVEQMNKKPPNMDNDKWKSLAKNDPVVLKYQNSMIGKQLSKWQQDKSLGKLFLRDNFGNLVAGSKKPAVFNIGDRKAFTKVSAENSWHSTKVKPDPTTNQNAVQISIPVIQNGKKIGVLHTALLVE
ncbi:MAG: hypothetical protein ACC707_06715 [Thiohalomonadales bacterium]